MPIDYRIVINTLGDLPPAPVVALKALEVMQDPFSSAGRLAEVISRDPAVSAKILRTANSPLFYTGKAVATLNQAIVILGDGNLRQLVLEVSLRGVSKHFGLQERMLWESSVGAAVASRLVASKTGRGDAEQAFLAGLFSNIGKMAMNNHNRALYKRIFDADIAAEAEIADLERGYFAFTHAEVGAAVLSKWNLPRPLVTCVLYHHQLPPPGEADRETRDLTAIVNLAGGLCRHLSIGHKAGKVPLVLAELPGALELDLGEAKLAEICAEFLEIFREERTLFLM